MIITQGIYNGKNIELSEIIPFKEKKKVIVTFPEDKELRKQRHLLRFLQICLV